MAVDTLMKIAGIDGESQHEGNAGWIELQAWSWGAGNPSTIGSGTSGHTAGKPVLADVNFTAVISKATPGILSALLTGKHIGTIEIHCLKSTGEDSPTPFLKLTFTDCLFTGHSTNGSNGMYEMIESHSFSYSAVKHDFLQQKSDGTLASILPVTYDLLKVKKS